VVPAASLLPDARRAAQAAGVTRLADITRLDLIGFPVWQAVRPMSRALSVHQGKGASDAEAQLGAVLEAVESHLSETFDQPGPTCSFEALPERRRAPRLDDFAADRASAPSPHEPLRWIEAEAIGPGEPIHLPFDLVSMDFTRGLPSRYDRGSDGVATGTTPDLAAEAALHELIERDAVVEWGAGGLFACTADTIAIDTIPFGWAHHWRKRIEEAGASLRFYRVPSITGTPVIVCEINDFSKQGSGYGGVHGRGCHPLPEIALFKAMAGAIQSRATMVAGAREDVLPAFYAARAGAAVVAFGLPLPPAMRGIAWSEIGTGPSGCDALVEALVDAGYDRIALVRLGTPPGFYVVRAFVPGLACGERRRRPPVA
jgi:ribosomal protein S12 methylthiotransferase accessory factor